MKQLIKLNKQDEYYTPPVLVKAILPYIPKDKIVWCPFDTETSEFVIALQKTNKVVFSHIWNGQDFFEYTPPEFDVVVSNSPFSVKLKVLERLYGFGKPFAILLNLMCLNYQEVGEFFIDKELQLLIPDKKVSFDGNSSSFNSSYFCVNLLPSNLVFVHLAHNNTGQFFTPSRMMNLDTQHEYRYYKQQRSFLWQLLKHPQNLRKSNRNVRQMQRQNVRHLQA